MLENGLNTRTEGAGVSICPGPNMAYFSKKMSLKDITDHIYGRANMITRTDRPNMFIKELTIYVDFLKNKIDEAKATMTKNQEKYLLTFSHNLKKGISYYQGLFSNLKDKFEDTKTNALKELESIKNTLHLLNAEIGEK